MDSIAEVGKLIVAAIIGAALVYLAVAFITWEWWSLAEVRSPDRAFVLLAWVAASAVTYGVLE